MANEFMGSLETIADGINGQVFHSGGGIFGVRVDTDSHEFFFGFAEDVLGWDLSTTGGSFDGELIGSGVTDLTIKQIPEVIARCQEVIENREIGTITHAGHVYHVGDAVIYSVYPIVTNGTGTAQLHGIVSTGETLADMNLQEMSDYCPWENVYSVELA
jgi:hypothetical protein